MIQTLVLAVLVASAAQGGAVKRFPISREPRIINGTPAKQGEFPSQLSLQVFDEHYCGASVLNDQWALTAAHCVEGLVPEDLILLAGTVDLKTGGTTHQVVEIIMHEGYTPEDSWMNDIAVVRVSNSFPIDGVNVEPISLPAQGQNPADGSTATFIGWGYNENSVLPTILSKVDIAIVNQGTCSSAYASQGQNIYDGNICAEAPQGNKGACTGDDGGPLFVEGTSVGLMSWMNACNDPGYPTVFTRVSYYRDWIKKHTGV